MCAPLKGAFRNEELAALDPEEEEAEFDAMCFDVLVQWCTFPRRAHNTFPFFRTSQLSFRNRSGFYRRSAWGEDIEADQRRGFSDNLVFSPEQTVELLRPGADCRTVPVDWALLRRCYFDVKSSRVDEWFELLCEVAAHVTTRSELRQLHIELRFDHGS